MTVLLAQLAQARPFPQGGQPGGDEAVAMANLVIAVIELALYALTVAGM
jgi:hypothetical protein